MKKIKSLAVGVTAFAVLANPVTAFAGFWPADRQTYTCVNINQCEGADHVVFNSFTNNPVVGDERPFFAGYLDGSNSLMDTVNVKNGDVVTLRAFVHNNADPNKIGEAAAVAKNTRIRVLVPNDSKADHQLTAFLRADNADPAVVNDTMRIASDKAMTLSYVAGSAKFEHKANGTDTVIDNVDDTIVTEAGASLGSIKGCFQYSGYVTLKVKVNIPTTPPPVTPPKETPKTPAAPTTLPNTGAGEVAAIFAAVTAAGAVAYRFVLGRRLSRQ